jgi:hypothetical protein
MIACPRSLVVVTIRENQGAFFAAELSIPKHLRLAPKMLWVRLHESRFEGASCGVP